MYFQPTRIFDKIVDTASDSCTSGRVLVYDMFNKLIGEKGATLR
jgi:hypothetical protein